MELPLISGLHHPKKSFPAMPPTGAIPKPNNAAKQVLQPNARVLIHSIAKSVAHYDHYGLDAAHRTAVKS